MTAAAVSVLPVPVAISNRKRSLPSFTDSAEGRGWPSIDRAAGSEACWPRCSRGVPLHSSSGLGSVVWALGENDVVVADLLFDQALRIGRDLLIADDRIRRRETR